jgi:hypothetical protein
MRDGGIVRSTSPSSVRTSMIVRPVCSSRRKCSSRLAAASSPDRSQAASTSADLEGHVDPLIGRFCEDLS